MLGHLPEVTQLAQLGSAQGLPGCVPAPLTPMLSVTPASRISAF